MKRVFFLLIAVVVVVGMSGCRCCNPCGGCGCGLGSTLWWGSPAVQAAPSGPPTGTVTYPYYTNRGPRDFSGRRSPEHWPLAATGRLIQHSIGREPWPQSGPSVPLKWEAERSQGLPGRTTQGPENQYELSQFLREEMAFSAPFPLFYMRGPCKLVPQRI